MRPKVAKAKGCRKVLNNYLTNRTLLLEYASELFFKYIIYLNKI